MFPDSRNANTRFEEKGYLNNKRVEKIKHPATDFLKYSIKNNIVHLILQITQSCNLRCEYCIYSGEYRNRTHSSKQMSFETAKKAMDYYIQHSRDTEQLSVGFYGGEPCVNYELIQKCVSYMETEAEGREINYSMTTNATLLDEKNIEFFVKHGFNILISLDGPKELHDKHRKFAFTKKGTFDVVLEKVKYLKQKYPQYCKEKIAFNMVIDTENTFLQLDDFVRNNLVISDLQFQTNVIDPKNTDVIRKVNNTYIEEINYEKFKVFLELLDKIPQGSASKLLNDYDKELRKVLHENNSIIMSLSDESHHSGPCIPGCTRLFVTSEGVFYPCERVSEELKGSVIGNVDEGIILDKAENVLNYGKPFARKCRACWAYRSCDQCISYIGPNKHRMEEYCEMTRRNVLETIKDACVLEALGFDYTLTDCK